MAFDNTTDGPVDVLILGAGISGIGCAAYLSRETPDKTLRILEMRDDLGGTWDLFRYPGIRSDSDLYTFAYDFKPWESAESIADGAQIKDYIAETANDYAIRDRISFGRKVVRCDWSSDDGLWTITTERTSDGTSEQWQARWIFSGTGYYDYDKGYRPAFPEEDSFQGRIVHPQSWPQDLDTAGKRIAVIGSGATAVTLLPALAKTAAHVVQVQRTPSYVMPVPRQEPLRAGLSKVFSGERTARILRRKNIWQQYIIWKLCQKYPETMRGLIRKANVKMLPDDFPVDKHFNPPYAPWDQRLCAVPGGDLFRRLSDGSCSIVTGQMARFTETGIEMQDGTQVEADIIVTATGLNLKLAGGAEYSVDGTPVDWSDHVIYKGMMLNGIPNFAMSIGYTNSSWTLKVGLLCQYLCRLLKEMDARGMAVCVPVLPDRKMALRPLLDFDAGYVKRSLHKLPSQGDGFPWEMTFNYREDERIVKRGPVIGPELRLSPAPDLQTEAAQ